MSRCLRLAFFASILATAGLAALPVPPHQTDPWTAPLVAGIPVFVGDTARALFDAGLADPRGGRYSKVTVRSSPVFDEPVKSVKSHCWVFQTAVAVCWDGLVHAIESDDGPADLSADVMVDNRSSPWLGFDGPLRVGLPKTNPIVCFYLLRLGEVEMAKRWWQWDSSGNMAWLRRDLSDIRAHREWLRQGASVWLGEAFHVGVSAYIHADDRLALDVFQSLQSWRTKVNQAVEELDNAPPKDDRPPAFRRELDFLATFPAFLQETERRVRSSPNRPFRKEELEQLPRPARIKELIARLEDVSESQFSFPGAVMPLLNPICQMLSEQGEAAIEPLLDTLQFDQRLTRSVSLSRPHNPDRTPYSVAETARALLIQIAHAPENVHDASPEQWRSWWLGQKGKSLLERSYALLANDHGTPEQWLKGARELVQRSDVVGPPDGVRTMPKRSASKPLPPRVGEELRTKAAPSITKLIEQRAVTLASSSHQSACEMGRMLYQWDPGAALPGLKALANISAKCRLNPWLTLARMKAGDPGAAAEWALQVRTSAPDIGKTDYFVFDLMPMWMFPHEPAFRDLAYWLFLSPTSPQFLPDAIGRGRLRVDCALLAVSEYRDALATTLRDRAVVGEARINSHAVESFHLGNTWFGFGVSESGSRDVPLRMADLVAYELSGIEGFPAFQMHWPDAQRDEAHVVIAEFLRVHGPELRAHQQDLAVLLDSTMLEFEVDTSAHLAK
jgi:hypothetical protein